MKHTLILLLLPGLLSAQITLQFRAGTDSHINNPFLAIAPHLQTHGFALTPELMINVQNDKPVDIGLKISYQYKFIEAGYGRYAEIYSTDKYDAYKNTWANMYFASLHWKQYFFEADYLNGMRYGIGVRTPLNL